MTTRRKRPIVRPNLNLQEDIEGLIADVRNGHVFWDDGVTWQRVRAHARRQLFVAIARLAYRLLQRTLNYFGWIARGESRPAKEH
jgi:hypothetical protein